MLYIMLHCVYNEIVKFLGVIGLQNAIKPDEFPERIMIQSTRPSMTSGTPN